MSVCPRSHRWPSPESRKPSSSRHQSDVLLARVSLELCILMENEVPARGRVGFKKKQQPEAVSSRLGFPARSGFFFLYASACSPRCRMGLLSWAKLKACHPHHPVWVYQPCWPLSALLGTAAELAELPPGGKTAGQLVQMPSYARITEWIGMDRQLGLDRHLGNSDLSRPSLAPPPIFEMSDFGARWAPGDF